MTGAAGSLIMKYKNHPMKAGGQAFHGAGASADFAIGQPDIVVSNTGSSACQSCHNAPAEVVDAGYYIQSFPHYTPGYYKFMGAQNQAAFDTPATAAEYMEGREEFYNTRTDARARSGQACHHERRLLHQVPHHGGHRLLDNASTWFPRC